MGRAQALLGIGGQKWCPQVEAGCHQLTVRSEGTRESGWDRMSQSAWHSAGVQVTRQRGTRWTKGQLGEVTPAILETQA